MGSCDVTCVVCIILSILGTDVLKGDPLGSLDITDEVVKYLMEIILNQPAASMHLVP